MKVGIIGYGNVGRACEKEILKQKDMELIAIFSRHPTNNVLSTEKIKDYIGKIDVMFLCVGSQQDLQGVAFSSIKNFNIVDCYDNHSKLKDYIFKLNELAIENNKVALTCFGWDPGLFSLMRGLYDFLGFKSYTFWGKGTSQGHTEAVKNILNVKDAIQFTIPNKKMIKQIELGKEVNNLKSLHYRLCYVVCEKQFKKQIKQQILTMPDYFEGYETKVKFVSQTKLNKLKSFTHRGEVVSLNGEMKFCLNLKSNPEFTAKVMVAFSKFIQPKIILKSYGAYTIFDLHFSEICKENKIKFL